MSETKKKLELNATGKQLFIGILSVLLLIGVDQFTKYLAVTRLQGKSPFILIPKVFEFAYVENRGMAFGMLENQRWFFILLTSILVIAIGIAYLRVPQRPRLRVLRFILVLLEAGAVGNLIDRIFQGFVTDFLSFSLINFPVFNVADCYVVVSVILLFILILFVYKDEDYPLFSSKIKETKTV